MNPLALLLLQSSTVAPGAVAAVDPPRLPNAPAPPAPPASPAPGRLEEVTEAIVADVVGEETHMNDVVPAVENEVLEQAASKPVVAEVAVVDTPVAAPVAAAATAPAKDTSEEEDLIEGIVNTLIEDDGDGSSVLEKIINFTKFMIKISDDDDSGELLRVPDTKKTSAEDDDGDKKKIE